MHTPRPHHAASASARLAALLALTLVTAVGCQTGSTPEAFTTTPHFGMLGAPGTYTSRRTVSTCQDDLLFFWTTSRPSWRDALARLPPSLPVHRLAYLSVDVTRELYWVGSRVCHRVDAFYVVRKGFNFDARFPPLEQARDLPLFMQTREESDARTQRAGASGPTEDELREDLEPQSTPQAQGRVVLPRIRRVAVATLSASRATRVAERAALRATYVPGLRGALGERVQVERAREGGVDGRLVTLTNDSLVLERPDGQDVSVGFGTIVRVEVIGGDPTGPRARETLRFDTPLRARTSRGALRAWVGQAVVVELSDGTRLRGKLDAIEGTRILLELGGQKAVVVELSDARAISR